MTFPSADSDWLIDLDSASRWPVARTRVSLQLQQGLSIGMAAAVSHGSPGRSPATARVAQTCGQTRWVCAFAIEKGYPNRFAIEKGYPNRGNDTAPQQITSLWIGWVSAFAIEKGYSTWGGRERESEKMRTQRPV